MPLKGKEASELTAIFVAMRKAAIANSIEYRNKK